MLYGRAGHHNRRNYTVQGIADNEGGDKNRFIKAVLHDLVIQ